MGPTSISTGVFAFSVPGFASGSARHDACRFALAMSWEARWRDMILAGGAVLAAACSSTSQPGSPGPNFCCNANGDPCCQYLNCGGSLTPACSEKMACEADGGTWNYGTDGCGVVVEAGPDAIADSPADAPDTQPDPFCCNAASDPCCRYLNCGAALTPECSAELACKSDGGTYSAFPYTDADGSYVSSGCFFSSEAGPDATPDSEPPDAGGG
jgi:hypothetical protein